MTGARRRGMKRITPRLVVGLTAVFAAAVAAAALVSAPAHSSSGAALAARQAAASAKKPPADLLQRKDLIYGSEIGLWETRGGAALVERTGVPAKIRSARIPLIRFGVYDVFTDMRDPQGRRGTIRRADFDYAIRGITRTLNAVPWIKLLPVAAETITNKPGTVFVPPLNDLGRDLDIHKAVLAEVRKVYGGRLVVESDNEGEYDGWEVWARQGAPFTNENAPGVSRVLGQKYALTMPALKKYARDVLGFRQVVTVGYIGVPGGPGWGQRIWRDKRKPYGYACQYQRRWIVEFNTAVHAAYVASGRDPDYIPDVLSIHSYSHGPDFTSRPGYEFDDRKVYAFFRNWLVRSRKELVKIWGPTIGNRIRFSISEWNAGANEDDGTWSGFRDPARVSAFYRGWYRMLQGNGRTTGTGTRYWNACVFQLAAESMTGQGRYYNLIRPDGTAPGWFATFRQISRARR